MRWALSLVTLSHVGGQEKTQQLGRSVPSPESCSSADRPVR